MQFNLGENPEHCMLNQDDGEAAMQWLKYGIQQVGNYVLEQVLKYIENGNFIRYTYRRLDMLSRNAYVEVNPCADIEFQFSLSMQLQLKKEYTPNSVQQHTSE